MLETEPGPNEETVVNCKTKLKRAGRSEPGSRYFVKFLTTKPRRATTIRRGAFNAGLLVAGQRLKTAKMEL